MEFREEDSLGVSDDIPMYNPHILSLTIVDLVKFKRTWVKQPYTGCYILCVKNISKPLDSRIIKFIHDNTACTFLMNQQKRSARLVNSVQWNLWIFGEFRPYIINKKGYLYIGVISLCSNLNMFCWRSIPFYCCFLRMFNLSAN